MVMIFPYTTQEAAAYLGLSPRTLAAYRSKGTGPAYMRIEGNVRYLKVDLDSYMASRRVAPQA